MRLTRAAQRAQHGTDEIPDATDLNERAPLNEISHNASPEQVYHEEELPKKTPAKKAKGKGGAKKGAKAKKGKAAETEEEDEQVQIVHEDERQAAGSPASDEAVGDLAEGPSAEVVQVPMSDERPASPPSKAVRLTRRQLALQEEELKQSQRALKPEAKDVTEETPSKEEADPIEKVEETIAGEAEDDVEIAKEVTIEPEMPREIDVVDVEDAEEQSIIEPEPPRDIVTEVAHVNVEKDGEVAEESLIEPEPPRDIDTKVAVVETQKDDAKDAKELITEPEAFHEVDATPSVEITSEPEPKTLATEKPFDNATTPVASPTPSRRTSRSPSKSPMRIEESFEALDALEEALENVKNVTSFKNPIDEKSPRKKAFPKSADTPNTRGSTAKKTPLASRISRAPNPAPKSMKPTTTGSLARSSSLRVAPSKDVRQGSTETVDYLASKRRPVSVSFPTPPPPPKGRAPTKPTFQLSSNDVVAKLKAQKEERLKREAEGVAPKQRPISMPPPVKSSKPPTKPTFQLPGEKVAEKLKAQKEERLKREVGSPRQSIARPTSMVVAPPKSTKPLTKPNFQLPGSAVAEKLKAQKEERLKRMEEAEAAKKEAALKARSAPVRKPVTMPVRQQPGVSIPPPSQPAQTQRSSSLTSKRSSIVLSQSRSTSMSSANRNSALITKSTVTPVDAAALRLKGKEVFNRDKMENGAKERERKEKEEAARKARADAAERGRIASREWAEKQRRKMMGV